MTECEYKKECEKKEMYGITCSQESKCGLKNILDKNSTKQKYLVTGSSGLIGRAVVRKLRADGHKVHEYDLGGSIPTIKVDMIIHCAAHCVIRDVIQNPNLAKSNVDITFEVLEYAREKEVSKVIYLSSSRVVHQSTCSNPYIASKIFGEQLLYAYHKCYGINYVVIRPETVWGVDEGDVRVMRRWINNIKNGYPITVFGGKNKELSPIYINDFMDAFYTFVTKFDEKKNDKPVVISGTPKKVKKVISDMANFYKKVSNVIYKDEETEQPQITIELENDIRIDNNVYDDLKQFERDLR